MILTCRKLVERVTDAREGRLSALDRVSYAAHLAWCRHCRRYVAQMDQTVRALRHGRPDETAPPEVVAALLAALKKGQRPQ
jgi:anti-sigma factor RsiW